MTKFTTEDMRTLRELAERAIATGDATAAKAYSEIATPDLILALLADWELLVEAARIATAHFDQVRQQLKQVESETSFLTMPSNTTRQ